MVGIALVCIYILTLQDALTGVLGAGRRMKTRQVWDTLAIGVIKAGAIFVLWRASDFSWRTPVAVTLWVFELLILLEAVRRLGTEGTYTRLRGLCMTGMGVLTILGVNSLNYL